MNPNRTDQPKLHRLPKHMQDKAVAQSVEMTVRDREDLFSFIRDVFDYAHDAGWEGGYSDGHSDGLATGDLDGYNRGRQDAERRDG